MDMAIVFRSSVTKICQSLLQLDACAWWRLSLLSMFFLAMTSIS